MVQCFRFSWDIGFSQTESWKMGSGKLGGSGRSPCPVTGPRLRMMMTVMWSGMMRGTGGAVRGAVRGAHSPDWSPNTSQPRPMSGPSTSTCLNLSKLETDLDPELDTTSRPVNVNHYCPFDLETSFFSIMKMCSFLIGKRRDELRNVIIFNGH